jgi:hypothetical protein
MVRRRRNPRQRNRRRRQPRRSNITSFTHGPSGFKKYCIKYPIDLPAGQIINQYQLNKATVGSLINPFWNALTSTPGTSSTYSRAQIRVTNIAVLFNARGQLASSAPLPMPRLGCCVVPLTSAEINTSALTQVQQFGSLKAMNILRPYVWRIRLNPAFPICNFGGFANDDSRLLIYHEGYNGEVIVKVIYEVCGWPGITIDLLDAGATDDNENLDGLNTLFPQLGLTPNRDTESLIEQEIGSVDHPPPLDTAIAGKCSTCERCDLTPVVASVH